MPRWFLAACVLATAPIWFDFAIPGWVAACCALLLLWPRRERHAPAYRARRHSARHTLNRWAVVSGRRQPKISTSAEPR